MLPKRFGPFVLMKKLGSGGMGDAHLARPAVVDSGGPQLLVVKRIHAQLTTEDKMLRRFQHEAAIATSIESPHVARVFSMGKVGDTPYIAMEYIEGWPLSDVLADMRSDRKNITISSALDLVSDALHGIRALHLAKDDQGSPLAAVHRDVSPKNLMLGEDGRVRVIDLGLGKSRLRDWHTRTGAIMGTPGYMAPEQTLAREVDHRSDLYALGIVLFEVLTLEPYIEPGSIAEMLGRMAAPVYRAPSTVRPSVSRALDEVTRQALSIEPNDRFSSADAFLEALERARATRTSRAPASTLISELMFTELTQQRAKVVDLLASSESDDGAEPVEPTVVFARKSSEGDASKTALSAMPRIEPRPDRSTAWLKTGAIVAGAIVIGMQIERFSSSGSTAKSAPIATPEPVGAPLPMIARAPSSTGATARPPEPAPLLVPPPAPKPPASVAPLPSRRKPAPPEPDDRKKLINW